MAKILGSLPSRFNSLITAWDSVNASIQNLKIHLKEESRSLSVDEARSSNVNLNKKTKDQKTNEEKL